MNNNTKAWPKRLLVLILIGLLVSPIGLSACQSDPTSKAPVTDTPGLSSETPSIIQQMAGQIKSHWPHMAQVWPGLDYARHNLILFVLDDDDQVKQAWQINTQATKQLTVEEYADLAVPQAGGFEKLDYAGQPSISASLSESTLATTDPQDFYRFITHELVHLYYQAEADQTMGESSRSQQFPVDKQPRLYRQMLYQNLIKAFQEPDKQADHLGRARYWHDLWKTQYSEEYQTIKAIDIAEATARYIENIATFISPETSADELRDKASQAIETNQIYTEASAESYELGYVAGLILDRIKPDWKETFYQQNVSVDEWLLRDIKPIAQEADPQLENKLSLEIERYNQSVQAEISPLITAQSDQSIPYLKLDVTQSTASMAATGMITYQGEDVILGYTNLFTSGGQSIKIENLSVYDSFDDTGRMFIVIPLTMPHQVTGDSLSIDQPGLRIDGIKVRSSQADGRTIYEAQVDATAEAPEVKTERAADDFYQHINGQTLAAKQALASDMGWDHLSDLAEAVETKLRAAVHELSQKSLPDDRPSPQYSLAKLYRAALDSDLRQDTGLGQLAPYLEAIDQAKTINQYLQAAAKIKHDLGQSSLLHLSVAADPLDSTKKALYLAEPRLMTNPEDLASPDMQRELADYLTQLLVAYGKDHQAAKSQAQAVVELSRNIASQAVDAQQPAGATVDLNAKTAEQLAQELSVSEIPDFLASAGLAEFQTIRVENPASLDLIKQLMVPQQLENLKAYTALMLLHDYANLLPPAFDKAKTAFLFREPDQTSMAYESVRQLAEMELGEIYSQLFFSPAQKRAAEKLTQDIIATYREQLKQSSWLSPESQARAIKKLDRMSLKIGYPDEFPTALKDWLANRMDESSGLIDLAVEWHKQQADRERQNYHQPVDKARWELSPQTLNAYYEPSRNEIIIPAALWQAPYFDQAADYAQNLGGIGTIIGHEISHAFDELGSQYDELGNLNTWWSETDQAKFKQLSLQVIDYYSQFEPVAGHRVDGQLTLGENIADLNGVAVTSTILKDNPAGLRQFFSHYAYIWASLTSDDTVIDQLQYDNHAPAKIRVNGVLQSNDLFYQAFDIQPGDKMYLPPEKRVKVY